MVLPVGSWHTPRWSDDRSVGIIVISLLSVHLLMRSKWGSYLLSSVWYVQQSLGSGFPDTALIFPCALQSQLTPVNISDGTILLSGRSNLSVCAAWLVPESGCCSHFHEDAQSICIIKMEPKAACKMESLMTKHSIKMTTTTTKTHCFTQYKVV